MTLAPDAYAGLAAGSFNLTAQERVVHGLPAGEAVRAEAERCGARRVLLVSTGSLARLADGPLQRVAAALGDRFAGSFGSVRAHSPREDVIAIAEAARAAGADLLVAVGGGSAIDATKLALACLWMDLRSVDDLEALRADAPAGTARPITAGPDAIRMLSVSTTLSASDFTGMAGVTDSRTRAKQMFVHRLMVPRVAVLDPAATLDTPLPLLFATAIRSVDHAVECWCSPMATPATEALSLQGLTLLARALPAIQAEPGRLGPRLDAQFGMWQAVAALASGVQTGASHGIGYALGAGFGVAHGHTSCVLLPAVMQWNAEVNAPRQQALSQAMGQPGRPAHELVDALIRQLGQPRSLREVGITAEQLGTLAERALPYPPVKANPRPIRSADDVRQILQLCW